MMVKLFEKVDGLLVEVHPDKAEEARKGRRVSRVVACEMDVLFTPEEEADRDLQEAEAARAAEAEAQLAADEEAARQAIQKRLGLSDFEMRILRGAR